MAAQIQSLGGMYGSDAGATYRVASIARPANLSSMGTAVDASVNDSGPSAAPVQTIPLLPAALANTPLLGHALSWWAAIFLLLFVLKWASEKTGESGEFRNIRIGGLNMLVITLTSILGITLAKMFFGKYRVAALSDLILAA